MSMKKLHGRINQAPPSDHPVDIPQT